MPSGSPVLRALGLVGMALVCSTPIAAAAAPSGQESVCPALQAVEEAAGTLLGRSSGGANRLDEAILIQDLGDRYTVRVKGSVRAFTDEARDCDARARAAAVFVALTLSPSSVTAAEPQRDQPPASPAPPPAIAVSPTVSKATRSWWTQVEIGAMGASAPRSQGSLFVVGAELRLVLTQARLGMTLGGSLPTPSTIDLGTVQVRQARYPFDLGPRVSWHSEWFFTALDLGPLAALCQLRRANVVNVDAPTTTRVELGARGAATLGFEGNYFAVFLRASTEFILVTHKIAVEPEGTIGQTSAVWMGITVGVAGKFH